MGIACPHRSRSRWGERGPRAPAALSVIFVARNAALTLKTTLAALMAIAVSELALGYVHRHAAEEEPVGRDRGAVSTR